MAEPKSKAAESTSPRPRPAIQPTKLVKPLQGFIDFVREQGVVGLGVAFVVGSSANTLIKSAVLNLMTPIIGLAIGGVDLSSKAVCLHTVKHVCKSSLSYGQFISDLITFLLTLFFVYLLVRQLRLGRLDKPKS